MVHLLQNGNIGQNHPQPCRSEWGGGFEPEAPAAVSFLQLQSQSWSSSQAVLFFLPRVNGFHFYKPQVKLLAGDQFGQPSLVLWPPKIPKSRARAQKPGFGCFGILEVGVVGFS